MPRYGSSHRMYSIIASGAIWELRASATHKPKVFEIGVALISNLANPSTIGLGRPASQGIGPRSILNWVDESDGNAPPGLTTTCVDWQAPPPAPATYLRRVTVFTALGSGILWTFPRGLGVPVSGSLSINIIASACPFEMWSSGEE